MQNIRMRIMKEDDVPAVAALNNAAIPAMTELSDEQVLELFRMSSLSLVATNRDKSIAAFLISLGMGADYASENYQWFEKRGTRHQYIDRIVVAPSAKGTGVGRAFYESVLEHARTWGANELTTEVRLRPANPASMAFHERMGFRQVAEQETRGGTVRVALLTRSVY